MLTCLLKGCWRREKDLDSSIKNLKSRQRDTRISAKTFLTKDQDNSGDDETFYLHVLRFYLPQIATKTLDEMQCGLGIYTMQGFEHRYKQSKNIKK